MVYTTMFNREMPWVTQDRGKDKPGKAVPYRESGNAGGQGTGVGRTRGERGNRSGTKAGICREQKEISIYHRPITFWGKKDVGGFPPEDAGKTNPRGLRYAVAIRYRNSGQIKPNPVIPPS